MVIWPFGHLEISNFENSLFGDDVKNLEIWRSGNLKSEDLVIWTSGHLAIWTSGDINILEFPKLRILEIWKFENCGIWVTRDLGLGFKV